MAQKTEEKLVFDPSRDFYLYELIDFFKENFHLSGEECIGGTQTKDIIHSLQIAWQRQTELETENKQHWMSVMEALRQKQTELQKDVFNKQMEIIKEQDKKIAELKTENEQLKETLRQKQKVVDLTIGLNAENCHLIANQNELKTELVSRDKQLEEFKRGSSKQGGCERWHKRRLKADGME